MALVDVNKKIKNESDWSEQSGCHGQRRRNSVPSVPPSVAWAALLAQAKLQSLTLSLQQKLIGRAMFNPLEAVQAEGLDKV